MAEIVSSVRRAAPSSLPVLLVGSTGTGKERFARAVHHFSNRTGPFIAINCAALPEQLSEAELFGYRRGAFTGAERGSIGHFRAAHQGTLFLDEMPELTAPLQAKLLRVIEDGQVLGLGESHATPVDVRIISASQRPLGTLVARGKLREDLAARLTGVELLLPPLAQRRTDIAPLFAHVLRQHAGSRPPPVEARLIEALCSYDWPRNVRELELATKALLAVRGHEPTLLRSHLPAAIAGHVEEEEPARRPLAREPVERRAHDLAKIKALLETNGGNIKGAAAELGISRQRVYRLMNGNMRGDKNDLGS
jgi:transcriptional regulator with PAS, ATPase and Fis domain